MVLTDFHKKFTLDPKQTRFNFINSQLLMDANLELQLSEELNIEGLDKGLDILTTWDLREPLFDVKNPGLLYLVSLMVLLAKELCLFYKKITQILNMLC